MLGARSSDDTFLLEHCSSVCKVLIEHARAFVKFARAMLERL